MKQVSLGYFLISNFYGKKTTKRSGVPLINHIEEGLDILESINADFITKEAYCIHPMLQSDEFFNRNYEEKFLFDIPVPALLLAMEYRRVANSYLLGKDMSEFVGFTNERVKQMLFADKTQNEKDFALYHEGTHAKSKELREYFNNWLNILLIDYKK